METASGFSKITTPGERGDCVVVAFATVASVPYETAHAALAKHGRKKGCRTRMSQIAHKVAETLNVEMIPVRRSGTLRSLIRDFHTGRMLVRVTGHAFAIIDGIIHDREPQSLDRHVKMAWRVK